MSNSNIPSFITFFINNFEEIKTIPEKHKLTLTLFQSDFDRNKMEDVMFASASLKQISELIISEYKTLVSTTIIHDTHNAGIQNGELAGSRYNHDIEGRIPDFVTQLLEKCPAEHSAKDIALTFLETFYFWTDCYCCVKRYPMHVDISKSKIYPLEINEYNICTYPNGIRDEKYSFTVKSGKLIFANDFRTLIGNQGFEQWAKTKTGQHQTVNTGYGSTLFTQYWMEQGLIYIFTGNSCPSVQISEDKHSLAIACGKLSGYNFIDTVCTDLWAVQALDYEHFIKLCCDSNIDDMIEELGAFIIEVKNGEYEITDHNKYPCKEEYYHFATLKLKQE